MFVRALQWPVITWIVVDLLMLAAVLLFGDIAAMMTPAALVPLLLAFGLWAGFKIVKFGGGYANALVAGFVLGAVCAILIVIGFGMVLASTTGGVAAVIPLVVFGLIFNVFGALIGGGFALTR